MTIQSLRFLFSAHLSDSEKQNDKRLYSYGLHTRCSAVTGTCVPFPRSTDCTKDPSFCNMWRTVGFLISFGVVVELCTLVSFVVIIAGGVQRRVAGWQVAVGVLMFSAVVQCAGMAIVVCPGFSAATVCLVTHPNRVGRPFSLTMIPGSGMAGISISPGHYVLPVGLF